MNDPEKQSVPSSHSEQDPHGSPAKRSLITRSDVHATVQEYVGTTVFLFLAYGGVQAGAAGLDGGPQILMTLYASICFGLSLLASAWIFYRITGSLFNTNISLALWLLGLLSTTRFILYSLAQLAGGITAAALVLALTTGPIASNTTLAPEINAAQGVFIEMFMTAILIISVLMLAVEKHRATPFAPIGIGLTIFICHLFSVHYTGAGLNTARSFGPAVVSGFPSREQWVYWVGPCLGSFLAAGYFSLLKYFGYHDLNPGQTSEDEAHSPSLRVFRSFRSRLGSSKDQDALPTTRRNRADSDGTPSASIM